MNAMLLYMMHVISLGYCPSDVNLATAECIPLLAPNLATMLCTSFRCLTDARTCGVFFFFAKTARTYERVATSHGRWVWAGADDLAWASKAWRMKLGSLRGKVSLWEGGLFGRLMRSPEAIAALRAGAAGVSGGVGEVSPQRDDLCLCDVFGIWCKNGC